MLPEVTPRRPVQQAPLLPRTTNWGIGFTRLRVENAQEDRRLASFSISNGDEPYLILIGFKGEFGTTGSTQIITNQYQDDEWAENTRSGDIVNIPATMGVFEFRGVTDNTVLGVIALAMESDRTPWPIVEDRVRRVVSNVQGVVMQEIEGRTNPDLVSTAFIDNLHQALIEAAMPLTTSTSTTQAFENLIFSGVDTDELIGINSIVFMTVPPSQSLNFPYYSPPYFADILADKDYTLESFPLEFSSNSEEARYETEMKVRSF